MPCLSVWVMPCLALVYSLAVWYSDVTLCLARLFFRSPIKLKDSLSVQSNSLFSVLGQEHCDFVFVFVQKVDACEAMNGCLMCLAQEYPTVKFCKLSATEAKMSTHFVS